MHFCYCLSIDLGYEIRQFFHVLKFICNQTLCNKRRGSAPRRTKPITKLSCSAARTRGTAFKRDGYGTAPCEAGEPVVVVVVVAFDFFFMEIERNALLLRGLHNVSEVSVH